MRATANSETQPQNRQSNLNSRSVVDAALGLTRTRRLLVILSALMIASIVVAVGLGPVFIAPGQVLRIIGHHVLNRPSTMSWPRSADAIIWDVRFPRVLLGALVGAALGVTGLALQAIVRNPLAEPYILGVSSGASTGAAAAILFGVGSSLGSNSVSVVAFIGALLAMLLVLSLARAGGSITPGRMLVAGVAVGYVLNSTTSLLVLFSDSTEGGRAVMFWLLGSLGQAGWSVLPVISIVVFGSIGVLWWWRRRLDALAIGDETAYAIGVDPVRTRFMLIVVIALCIGASVAVSGGIGFVGLAIPHIARRLAGASSHRITVPASALLGALLLVWADVGARLILQPRELPIGVVTGILGAPVLVILVRRLQSVDT